ncbi:triose-phosphate isomerase [Thalassotalea sp. PLHSN55]|uniref:triose-phosphate isomerase n=1 Tax=Thalassotalea sp. PLHSN55 TaxID=3435888 RepID=UPI003F854A2A
MTNKLVIGNWKMNGDILTNAALVQALLKFNANETDIVICPPAIYLSQVQLLIEKSDISLGAQNVSSESKGAFTGENAANMLKDIGCNYCLVGHSERRALFHETSEDIAQKITQLLSHNMTPVFCIGESLAQRENNETKDVIITQIQSVLALVGQQEFASVVIAYEPIWAIGTGKTASAAQAQEIHQVIRDYLNSLDNKAFSGTQILYGGSVNEGNANELIAQPDIDGFLVGGASLKAQSFEKICQC